MVRNPQKELQMGVQVFSVRRRRRRHAVRSAGVVGAVVVSHFCRRRDYLDPICSSFLGLA